MIKGTATLKAEASIFCAVGVSTRNKALEIHHALLHLKDVSGFLIPPCAFPSL